MRTIHIILGSIREGRNGEKVAKWLFEHAAKRTDMKFELVDLKDWPLPIFSSGKFPSAGDYDLEIVKKWSVLIDKADGYIFVTPEYNHGMPSVLKNALDHIYKEWKRKPAAIVSYGGLAGGVRSAEQLRQVLAEFHVADIRETLVIPGIFSAFDDKGQPVHPSLSKNADVMLDDLAWWTEALAKAREASA